jgi:NADH-quinone oxidoreductase subunit N
MLAVATSLSVAVNYTALLPELILMGGAVMLLAVSALSVKRLPAPVYAAMTGGFAVASLISSVVLWEKVIVHGPSTTVDKSIAVDGFSVLFMILVCSVLILSALFGEGYLRREGLDGAEYFALAMLSGSGAMFMASAGDLIVVFLGLEILSIALYVLAGIDLRRAAAGEAAIKYFVLGAFSSAIFVYGIALVYGATGSTNIAQIAAYLAHNPSPGNGLLLAGVGLLLVGFGFKIAAVPFHMWTPDVYQGSPTPVAGFMASVAKAGGFAALLRVFYDAFPSLSTSWQPMVWVLAVLSLVTGAVLALVQRDVKRMLAYSSINHAGFILLGLQAGTIQGLEGALYYLFAYAVIVVGTFGLIAFIGGPRETGHQLSDYRGLARRHPAAALALTILLVAQAGVPPSTGFLAKFYVVGAAVQQHSYALAVIAMVSAAIAGFFYLRVVAYMYAGEGVVVTTADAPAVVGAPPLVAVGAGGASYTPGDALPDDGSGAGAVEMLPGGDLPVGSLTAGGGPLLGLGGGRLPASAWLATALCVGTTVVLGIWPQPLFDFAHAAKLLF